MKRGCLGVGALGLVLTAGCFGGSGGSGGGDGDKGGSGDAGETPFRPSVTTSQGCARVTEQCPTVLADFGLFTGEACESTFDCVSARYASMPSCSETLNELVDCFADLSSADCSACDALMDEIMECPEPTGCLDTETNTGQQ